MEKEKVKPKKVGIVSLGLIGSSILKRLYKKYDCYCFSYSLPQNAKEYCSNLSNNIEIVKDCDIVFVCSPINNTLEMLEKLDGIVRVDCIVSDCASVKNNLLNKKFNYNFILSHPMAGIEKQGFDAGYAELFEGAKWLIEKNNSLLETIIKELGAIPLLIDMNIHDELTAQISHLPALLSYLLFNNAQNEAKQIASSGFRDMTRLSMGSSKLIFDMLKYNKKNILKSFNKLFDDFNKLETLSDKEKIEFFEDIASKRKEMYDNNGKNIFKI